MIRLLVVVLAMFAAWPDRSRAEGPICPGCGPVRPLSFDADYNAALILLPEVWSAIPNLPADLVVAVPARDIVAFGDGADPEAVASLRRIAQMPSDGYPVTKLLLQRVRGRWMVKN